MPLRSDDRPRQVATGTDGGGSQFAPEFAPNTGKRCQSESFSGKTGAKGMTLQDAEYPEETRVLRGFDQSGRLDSNQRPLRPERAGLQSEPYTLQELTDILSAVCTSVCTKDSNSDRAKPLEALADALRRHLPTGACRQLAELLGGNAEGRR